MKTWSTEDFYSPEAILSDTMMVDTCPYTFVKIHRSYNTNVNSGLEVTLMCQCRFTGLKKYTTLVQDVNNRGCVGAKGMY